jgi:putative transposase
MRRLIIRQLAINVLNMVIKNEGLKAGLTHHSGSGVQCASNEFHSLLKTKEILYSYESKRSLFGKCCRRKFLRYMKGRVDSGKTCDTRQETKTTIFECIERFYIQKHRHFYLSYLISVDFFRKRMRLN